MRITVAVPCHNYGRFLDVCMTSILSQEGVDVDVVIIDDCSTDNTRKLAAAWQTIDPYRVRVIRNSTNKGYCETFNMCIDEAREPYFTLVSADDALVPGALYRAVDIMEQEPRVGLVYGHSVTIDINNLAWSGRHRGKPPTPRLGETGSKAVIIEGREWNRRVCRTGKNAIIGSEAVLRTSVQKEAGFYDPLIPHAADAEMWLRVASLTDVAYVRGADQMLYRFHHDSMQRTVFSADGFDHAMRERSFRSAYQKGAITEGDLKAALSALAQEKPRPYPDPNFFRREVWARLEYYTQRHTGLPV